MRDQTRVFALGLAFVLSLNSAPCFALAETPPIDPKHDTIQDKAAQAQDTKQDDQTRDRLKAHFWNSTLGQMMTRYLEPSLTTRETSVKAHEIANRVYSEVALTIPRTSAIEFMVVDLYEQDRMDGFVRDRIVLLQSIMSSKANEMEGRSYRSLYNKMPSFALIGFLSGSDLVNRWTADKSSKIFRLAYSATVGRLFGVDHLVKMQEWIDHTPIGKLMLPFFKGYDAKKAFGNFARWFTIFAIFYSTIRSGTTANAPVVARLGIYELEKNVHFEQL